MKRQKRKRFFRRRRTQMEFEKYKSEKMKSFNRGLVWSIAKIPAMRFEYSRPKGGAARSRELSNLRVNVKSIK
jgi:hypothetical protein